MKKIIYQLLFVGVSTFTMTGCNDQLDIEQHGVLNRSTYYLTDSDAEESITAAYCGIAGLELNYFMVKNVLSGDTWPGTDGHTNDYCMLHDFSYDSEISTINSLFTDFYNIIGKCNTVLENIKGDTDFQRQVLAEAKVIRAWMYFELTTLWGNPPLVDHTLSPDETALPNSEPAELYAFMERDLTEAISSGSLLQKKSIDDNTLYHVSKQYAQALLGKVYLWQGKNQEAVNVLEEVINSGLYGLVEGEYSDIFSVKNENNREMMFESNFIVDEANPGSCLRFYPIMQGLHVAVYNYGDNKYDIISIGWGALQPKQALYDAFVSEESSFGYRLSQVIKTPAQLKADGYSINAGMFTYGEGYYMLKTSPDKAEQGHSSFYDYGGNIHWMRYAEVLLLAAEANLAAGNQAKADEYLNLVRLRAHLYNPKTATLDAIKLEKRLELCNEGVRYQDLLRWGDAAKELANNGVQTPCYQSDGTIQWNQFNTNYGFKVGKHERFPFPATEIRMNKNIKQNPNW